MYEWIIVGGGIQGATVAAFLLKCNKASADTLRIIDPHDQPLANWKRVTDYIEMPYLRSPSVHHIDVHHMSLQKYVNQRNDIPWNHAFYGRYKRPSLSVFNEHCEQVIEETQIYKTWVQGRVTNIRRESNAWLVSTPEQSLKAKRVVLAFGVTEQPLYPDWAKSMKEQVPDSLFYIFDLSFTAQSNLRLPVTIVGAGITAAHLAVKLTAQFPGQVTMIKRHPFRVHDFDSAPGWLGPKYMHSFLKIQDYKERRSLIKNARHKGSMPSELHSKLLHLERRGALHIINDEIEGASRENEKICLHLKESGAHAASTVILATGFQPALPGKELLQPLIEQEQLLCAECGYPIVSPSLEWTKDLYVAGGLAELEIGPSARNISGARSAAERIVNSL
ncbi:FAD/NAD(P)-binding protein [Ectobacillus panaciterrae]|uniref:FAD/NAD(P)-binding protein n=1 Tax=Ectobacillus panaciterrae TaxID=363872 RepID=UPI00040EAC30|nr:FAD/NAD(P)-binding protein [Ectobacillus panaciterrae]